MQNAEREEVMEKHPSLAKSTPSFGEIMPIEKGQAGD